MTYYIIHPRGNNKVISVIGLDDPRDIRDYERANMKEFTNKTPALESAYLFAETHSMTLEIDLSDL